MKKITAYLKTISLIAIIAILSGCSSNILVWDFLNPPPRFVDLHKNKNFSSCSLRTGGKTNEGPVLTFEFRNIRNNISKQENIFFSIDFHKDNPIWNAINVEIGDLIVFKTEDGQTFSTELTKDFITKNNIKVENKTHGKIAYLNVNQVDILKNQNIIYLDLTLKPGSQKRFKGHLTSTLPTDRMNIFWHHCLGNGLTS